MIGRKYKAVGVKLNYNLVKQTSGSIGQFRILVCWFNQTPPGFAAPDFTKYFNNVDDGGTQIPAYLATQNSSTTGKMKIYMTNVLTLALRIPEFLMPLVANLIVVVYISG